MKVYISNYRNHWISPYTILEKVLFWKDWDNIEYDTPWVEKWSNRLNPFCVALHKFLDFVFPRITYVKIDRYDTWNMDHTLCYIILPMLKQLKKDKHGAPYVDDADVPEGIGLRSTEAKPKENEWDTDDNHFKRWDWVMDEMIFAFEHKIDDSWEDQYRTGHIDLKWEETGETHFNSVTKKEEKVYKMVDSPLSTYKVDYDAIEKINKRMDNGFALFGKYYRGLWD